MSLSARSCETQPWTADEGGHGAVSAYGSSTARVRAILRALVRRGVAWGGTDGAAWSAHLAQATATPVNVHPTRRFAHVLEPRGAPEERRAVLREPHGLAWGVRLQVGRAVRGEIRVGASGGEDGVKMCSSLTDGRYIQVGPTFSWNRPA